MNLKAAAHAAIAATFVAGGAASLLMTDETTVEVADVADAALVPDEAFGISDKDGAKRGWAKNDKGAKELLKRAKTFKGDPERIDVFTAEACPSGLGYEVFTADAGYDSECLPEGIFTEVDAGPPVVDAGEESDAGEVEDPPEMPLP